MLSVSDTNYGNTGSNSKKDFPRMKNLAKSKRGALGDSGGITTAKDSILRSSHGSESRRLHLKSKLKSSKNRKIDKPKWRRQSDSSFLDSEALQMFEFQLKNQKTEFHIENTDGYNTVGDKTVQHHKQTRRKNEWLNPELNGKDCHEKRFLV